MLAVLAVSPFGLGAMEFSLYNSCMVYFYE